MKKYLLLMLLASALFFVSTNAFAFSDIGTHPTITEKAAGQSILGCDGSTYLKDNLGFKNSLKEIILPKKTIKILLTDGSRSEDTGISDPGRWESCSRGLNHFYDPSKSNQKRGRFYLLTLLVSFAKIKKVGRVG